MTEEKRRYRRLAEIEAELEDERQLEAAYLAEVAEEEAEEDALYYEGVVVKPMRPR